MPRRSRARRIPGVAAAAVLLSLAAAPPEARPYTLDDFLSREDLGAVELAGRALVIERRGPTTQAARFDLDALQDLERTTLWVTDLAHPGPARPLFAAGRRAGYALGPPSPDGRHVAVMRLTDRNWELGVADPVRRSVRWFGITPEMTSDATTVAWTSDRQLLVVARRSGALPRNLRYRRVYANEAPALWRTTARGGVAARVFESGPAATRALDRRILMSIDVRSSQRRRLAAGPFISFTLGPDHRHAAVLVEGSDHPMSASHAVQGAYGFAANARHIQIVDLDTGASRPAAVGWEVLLHPLAWSDDGRTVLAFGRDAIVPWADGRFLRIDGATGHVSPIQDVRAALDARPEAARAGWFGDEPLVWGTAGGAPAPGWWRVSPGGLLPLTAQDLGIGKDSLTRTPAGMVAAGHDGLWRLSPAKPPALLARDATPIRYPQLDRAFVFDYDIPTAARVVARRATGELVAIGGDGAVLALPKVAQGVEVLHPSDAFDGLVVRRNPRGGVLDLDLVPASGPSIALLRLNQQLAGLDAPAAYSIRHVGPNGESLISWLLLPRTPPGAPPPPLIVRPYPGAQYPLLPASMDSRTGGPDKAAALLAAHGYAVLAPSLPISQGAEPAQDLAARVLAIVDQAARDPDLQGRFDATRLGVWGESFGGWGTLTLITQTRRFEAAVAEASMSDLVSEWGQFETFVRLDPTLGPSPFFTEGWVEDVQGGMHAPPWRDPERYIRNSPIFQADRVTTPLLLLHGEQDAFSIAQAEEMFSALARQDKPAQLVTYWGEGHAIASPESLRDLYGRVFRWFDGHLLSRADGARPGASLESASASSARTPPPRPRTSAPAPPTGR